MSGGDWQIIDKNAMIDCFDFSNKTSSSGGIFVDLGVKRDLMFCFRCDNATNTYILPKGTKYCPWVHSSYYKVFTIGLGGGIINSSGSSSIYWGTFYLRFDLSFSNTTNFTVSDVYFYNMGKISGASNNSMNKIYSIITSTSERAYNTEQVEVYSR